MNRIFLNTIINGVLRIASVGITFLITAFATRLMTPIEAGMFLFALSLVTVGSSFFRMGLDNVLVRSFGAEGITNETTLRFARGSIWVVILVGIACLLGLLLSETVAINVYGDHAFTPILRYVCLTLPFLTLVCLFGFSFQGIQRFFIANVLQNLGVRLLFVVFALVVYFDRGTIDAKAAFELFMFSSIIFSLLAVWLWYRQSAIDKTIIFDVFRRPKESLFDGELWKSSSNLWVAATMILLVQWSANITAGFFVEPELFAYLSAAQRTAGLISFVLIVINMTVAPRYAKLWKAQKIEELSSLARNSTLVMILAAMPLFFCAIFFSDKVLLLFGPEYSAGSHLLIIMATGQMINVATGSVGYLLNMSGHDKDFRRITLISGISSILIAVGATWQWGVEGAAYATAFAIAMQNIMALFMVKRRLGFFPLFAWR
ncbi:oligosaccharide flippase family protein [Oceanobacter sp. 5_MG-2023]|uniref:oligosaccharide flippase family protein n=1 Tax=Oceanobacter sp. 5_MG-2023 TaxID=3062645 RepID=UPI0026E2C942|nr:oligosaccharide flippase family protein [Oceanobacter sp. 5_MG-2023]MDO6681331.1 oligosaccharide flippase family protein [Oceanobacter sp. 5_MG-2023]